MFEFSNNYHRSKIFLIFFLFVNFVGHSCSIFDGKKSGKKRNLFLQNQCDITSKNPKPQKVVGRKTLGQVLVVRTVSPKIVKNTHDSTLKIHMIYFKCSSSPSPSYTKTTVLLKRLKYTWYNFKRFSPYFSFSN